VAHSICIVPDPVNSTRTAIENRLGIAQIIGRRVREIRKVQALSQRELAGRLNVPRTYLSKVETCKVLPTIGTLYRLAGALRVEFHHLLFFHEVLDLYQDPFLVEIASMIHSLAPEQKAVILRAVREMAIRRTQVA
jgi:transcriptional regulator with XRE-family HTH domain